MFGIMKWAICLQCSMRSMPNMSLRSAALRPRRTHVGDAVKHAPIWGLGYTLTLFVFASREIMGPQCIGARVMLQPEVSARGSLGTGAD